MTSSPVSVATTKAGRFFAALKSENGKRATTTSPFTNAPMRHPLQGDPNHDVGRLLKRTSSYVHRGQQQSSDQPHHVREGMRQNHTRRPICQVVIAASAHRFRQP